MDFKQSVTTCLQKYADFGGRATRSEFWWFALACVGAQVVGNFLGYYVGMVVSLALLLPSLAVGSRRLHDINKSGWFQLIWLIPFIGWAVMIYFLVQPTVAGNNQYGEAPALAPETPATPATF